MNWLKRFFSKNPKKIVFGEGKVLVAEIYKNKGNKFNGVALKITDHSLEIGKLLTDEEIHKSYKEAKKINGSWRGSSKDFDVIIEFKNIDGLNVLLKAIENVKKSVEVKNYE